MGYAIILVQLSKVKLIQFGVIQMGKYGAHELKLKKHALHLNTVFFMNDINLITQIVLGTSVINAVK